MSFIINIYIFQIINSNLKKIDTLMAIILFLFLIYNFCNYYGYDIINIVFLKYDISKKLK